MKNVRKVLSVFLAVAMLIGTLAVGASAAYITPEEGGVEWKLSAEVFDPQVGTDGTTTGAAELVAGNSEAAFNSSTKKTVQTKDMSTYKKLTSHTYLDGSKAITVTPGQVVFVTLGIKTTGSLYPLMVDAHLYYSNNGFFLSPTLGVTASGVYAAGNPFSTNYGAAVSVSNWAALADNKRASTAAKGADTSAWHGIYVLAAGTPGAAEEASFEDAFYADYDGNVVTVPIYISPNAKAGTTGTIKLGGVGTDPFIQGYPEGDLYSSDTYVTNNTTDDYSGAVLTFTIPASLDYTALDAQIEAFGQLNEEDWTTESWSAAEAKYDAAVAAKTEATTQDAINTAASELQTAIGNLVPAAPALDYTELEAAIASVPEDLTLYTTESAGAVTSALETATGILLDTSGEITQDDIDNAADALNSAVEALDLLSSQFADLLTLIDTISQLDPNEYTSNSWDALAGTLSTYSELIAMDPSSVGVSMDEEVEAAYGAINGCYENLKECIDVTELTNAYSAASSADSNDYSSSVWDEISYNMEQAGVLIANPRDYAAEDYQTIADKYAEDILDLLNQKLADYSELDTAIATANEILDDSALYDQDEKWTAFENAYSEATALSRELTVDNQKTIDDATAALNTAISELNKLMADYNGYDSALSNADEIITQRESWYTAESFIAYVNAVNEQRNIDRTLTISDQDIVDTAVAAIIDAANLLVEADANYDALNEAKASVADLNELDYTEASWTNLQDVLDEVALIPDDLKAKDQETINIAAGAINNAREALVPVYADTTALAAEVATAAALNLDMYEDGNAKSFFQSALAAAQKILSEEPENGYPKSYQTTIDEAKTELINTKAGLSMKGADYTAVNNAITRFEQLDKSLYTEESLKAVTDAIDAVEEGKKIDEQDAVNQMAKAINDAIDNLKKIPKGTVTEANYTPSTDRNNTFTIKVADRATKVQFVKVSNTSSTNTFTRSSSYVTITSYNSEGVEVGDLSRDIAYEIWTINTFLNPDEYYVRAKYAEGWEDFSVALTFDVSLSASDKDVKSITPAKDTVTVGEELALEVVTGKDVIKVQVLVDDAETGATTFTAENCATKGDDSLTYNIFVKLYRAGDHTLKIRIKTADGWEIYDGTTADVTAVK